MNSLFITGTDTGVGKTYVCIELLKQFNSLNYKTFGIKPIASGCNKILRNKENKESENNSHCNIIMNSINEKYFNDDALALQRESSIWKPYEIVNPISLIDPIAPHIAAKNMGMKLSIATITEKIKECIQIEADINIIEGVGGWSVPLNETELMSDVVATLKIPVILVVGIKLGCLNHAILTYKSIINSKVTFIGWIANCVDKDALAAEENIETLKQWLEVPYLGTLAYQQKMNNLDTLFISKKMKSILPEPEIT